MILKVILISVLLYFVIRFLYKKLVPHELLYYVKKNLRVKEEDKHEKHKRTDTRNKPKIPKFKGGEYIEYEDINENK